MRGLRRIGQAVDIGTRHTAEGVDDIKVLLGNRFLCEVGEAKRFCYGGELPASYEVKGYTIKSAFTPFSSKDMHLVPSFDQACGD
jgi:hypothetical protein